MPLVTSMSTELKTSSLDEVHVLAGGSLAGVCMRMEIVNFEAPDLLVRHRSRPRLERINKFRLVISLERFLKILLFFSGLCAILGPMMSSANLEAPDLWASLFACLLGQHALLDGVVPGLQGVTETLVVVVLVAEYIYVLCVLLDEVGEEVRVYLEDLPESLSGVLLEQPDSIGILVLNHFDDFGEFIEEVLEGNTVLYEEGLDIRVLLGRSAVGHGSGGNGGSAGQTLRVLISALCESIDSVGVSLEVDGVSVSGYDSSHGNFGEHFWGWGC